MTAPDLDSQYRAEIAESLTRVNRIAAMIGIVVSGLLLFYADPANFHKEVSISIFGYEVLPHMII